MSEKGIAIRLLERERPNFLLLPQKGNPIDYCQEGGAVSSHLKEGGGKEKEEEEEGNSSACGI